MKLAPLDAAIEDASPRSCFLSLEVRLLALCALLKPTLCSAAWLVEMGLL